MRKIVIYVKFSHKISTWMSELMVKIYKSLVSVCRLEVITVLYVELIFCCYIYFGKDQRFVCWRWYLEVISSWYLASGETPTALSPNISLHNFALISLSRIFISNYFEDIYLKLFLGYLSQIISRIFISNYFLDIRIFVSNYCQHLWKGIS